MCKESHEQVCGSLQASTSAILQQRVNDLEDILRSETASLRSPSGLHATQADIHQHWCAAIAAGSLPERRPDRFGSMPIMRQLHGHSGVAAASDTASREVEAHSSCAALVHKPILACLHAQQEMLQRHLLPINRHMAHMHATAAALHHRMEQLQAFGG